MKTISTAFWQCGEEEEDTESMDLSNIITCRCKVLLSMWVETSLRRLVIDCM